LGSKIVNDDRNASHYLFCHTSKPNASTSQQVNNGKKAVMTPMLPGQQFAGDSAYLLMSHDVIWTNRMQVFCIEVQQ